VGKKKPAKEPNPKKWGVGGEVSERRKEKRGSSAVAAKSLKRAAVTLIVGDWSKNKEKSWNKGKKNNSTVRVVEEKK